MNLILLFLALALIAVVLFLSVQASTLAMLIKRGLPALLMAAGVGLFLVRQGALGSMLLFLGLALWRRFAGVGHFGGSQPATGKVSNVRSAALEMELDHDSGAMNGVVLVGRHEGKVLDEMNEEDLYQLREDIMQDSESLALLYAYFDRRLPGWRENTHADSDPGQAGASSSGTMGKEEAYEVLGLSPGATASDIRKAHRRLMKTAHPDSGGSTFLAAKINEAKDILLGSHS